MEYKKIGEQYYVRMDRGDEIIGNILEICRKESIPSAIFSGIGGCSSAELQVFIPETGSFETERLEGMLELVLLNGNVVSGDDGQLYHHTHALFSFKRDGLFTADFKDIADDFITTIHPDIVRFTYPLIFHNSLSYNRYYQPS